MRYAICRVTEYYGQPATSRYDVLDTARDWREANRLAAEHEPDPGQLVELPHNAYSRRIAICTVEEQGRTDDCHFARGRDGVDYYVRDPDDDTSQDPREVAADLEGQDGD